MSGNQHTLDVIEARARHIAGAIHSRGAIPARCWRQAIAERFLGERILDPEWAELMIARWEPKEQSHAALERLEAVAEASERYLAASNTLAFRPTKEVETAAAQAHHDLTEALNALD